MFCLNKLYSNKHHERKSTDSWCKMELSMTMGPGTNLDKIVYRRPAFIHPCQSSLCMPPILSKEMANVDTSWHKWYHNVFLQLGELEKNERNTHFLVLESNPLHHDCQSNALTIELYAFKPFGHKQQNKFPPSAVSTSSDHMIFLCILFFMYLVFINDRGLTSTEIF